MQYPAGYSGITLSSPNLAAWMTFKPLMAESDTAGGLPHQPPLAPARTTEQSQCSVFDHDPVGQKTDSCYKSLPRGRSRPALRALRIFPSHHCNGAPLQIIYQRRLRSTFKHQEPRAHQKTTRNNPLRPGYPPTTHLRPKQVTPQGQKSASEGQKNKNRKK